MIRNIIFDIGNVLAAFDWKSYLDSFKLSEEQYELVASHLYRSPMWKEVDRGAMSDDELLWNICKDLSGNMERLVRMAFYGTGEIVEEYRYAPELLESLKEEGYKVYLLSNYGKTFFESRQKKFEFLKYVDGKVISYEIKHIKPEPEIYEALLTKYRLKPDECLFFDDLQENCDAAERFGIHAINVKGYDSIIEGLDIYGISI